MEGSKLSRRGALIGAAVLFVLSALFLVPPLNVAQWKVTVLTTEYGHWFGVLCAALLAAELRRGRPAGAGRAPAALLAAAAALFFSPLALAVAGERRWKAELAEAFGASTLSSKPMISFAALWRGPRGGAGSERLVFDGENGLSLDFYRAESAAPAPLVVVVHTGGWDGGDPGEFAAMNRHLASRGYAVAAPEYRLAPASRWPAQREDVLAAVRYLAERRTELNVDPSRVVLFGRSAGGQIAESAAYAGGEPAIKGCIAFYAPSDLNFGYRFAEDDDILNSRLLLRQLLGGPPGEAPEAYADASPLDFVKPSSPPTLLVHGGLDPLTWERHSRRLREKFRAAGAACAYLRLPWATHGFDYNFNGPGGQAARHAVEHFLERTLGGGA